MSGPFRGSRRPANRTLTGLSVGPALGVKRSVSIGLGIISIGRRNLKNSVTRVARSWRGQVRQCALWAEPFSIHLISAMSYHRSCRFSFCDDTQDQGEKKRNVVATTPLRMIEYPSPR